jgi:hypothetical protein
VLGTVVKDKHLQLLGQQPCTQVVVVRLLIHRLRQTELPLMMELLEPRLVHLEHPLEDSIVLLLHVPTVALVLAGQVTVLVLEMVVQVFV